MPGTEARSHGNFAKLRTRLAICGKFTFTLVLVSYLVENSSLLTLALICPFYTPSTIIVAAVFADRLNEVGSKSFTADMSGNCAGSTLCWRYELKAANAAIKTKDVAFVDSIFYRQAKDRYTFARNTIFTLAFHIFYRTKRNFAKFAFIARRYVT